MKKQKLPQTCDAMFNEIKDIAGVRVVCSYINDVYTVFKILEQQDDLPIEKVKDYIKNPKPNGYRSLHLIVKVPVRLLTATEYVPVEIQIRTIAMDFWASLERDLRYKPIENSQNMDISSELLECSETIAEVEEKMQNMAKMLAKR